jgi:hypothetical protein
MKSVFFLIVELDRLWWTTKNIGLVPHRSSNSQKEWVERDELSHKIVEFQLGFIPLVVLFSIKTQTHKSIFLQLYVFIIRV